MLISEKKKLQLQNKYMLSAYSIFNLGKFPAFNFGLISLSVNCSVKYNHSAVFRIAGTHFISDFFVV